MESFTFSRRSHRASISGMGEASHWVRADIFPQLTPDQRDRFYPRGVAVASIEDIKENGDTGSRLLVGKDKAYELIGGAEPGKFNPERYAAVILGVALTPLSTHEIDRMNLE